MELWVPSQRKLLERRDSETAWPSELIWPKQSSAVTVTAITTRWGLGAPLGGYEMTPERDDLTVVERRIRAAKEYIYQQERLIERLADEANNTGDAFALLNILNRALRLFERYQLLLDRLGGRDAGDHSRHRVRHPAVVIDCATVCRQSISDSWLGNLRECLAHLV